MKYFAFEKMPIPTPNEKISSYGKSKVKYIDWGDKNEFPYFLNYLHLQSPTHGGIINGKVNYMYGGGLSNPDVIDVDDFRAMLLDFEKFNGVAVKVSPNGVYKHVPFENCRISEDGMSVFVFDDFRKKTGREYPNFYKTNNANEETIALLMGSATQYVDENGKKILTNYPLPTYFGAINSIVTEIEIDFFQLNEISNGFLGGTLISLNNGEPKDPETKQKLENSIKAQATARGRRGGITILYSNGKDRSPEILPMANNDLPDRYLNVTENKSNSIFVAHSVTSPMLFGIKTTGQLGGVTELETAYNIFMEMYVLPRRALLLEFLSEVTRTQLNIIDKRPSFLPTPQPQPQQQFKSNDDFDPILDELSRCGKPLPSGARVVMEMEIDQPIELRELGFDVQLTETQYTILQLLKQGEKVNEILKATGLTANDYVRQINILQELGFVDGHNITRKGSRQLKTTKSVLTIVYQYRKRIGVSGAPVIPTTRDFCRNLISLNRVYTRKEIDEISQRVGRDVWLYRGGFYHDPKQNKTFPFCRHTWWQLVIEQTV
jgi:hypothetical protein